MAGGNNGFKDEEKTDFSIPLLVAGTFTQPAPPVAPPIPTPPAGNSPVARDDTATVSSSDLAFSLFVLMIHPRLDRHLL